MSTPERTREQAPRQQTARSRGITIGVRHYSAATGTFTTIREPRTFEGELPLLTTSRFPRCECPRCKPNQTSRDRPTW